MSVDLLKDESFVDEWNSRERLYLASCILSHGDDNWSNISEVMKTFVNPKLRPIEMYSPEKCAVQYAWMIKDLESIKAITDDKESQLELLERYWREKRYKELKERCEKRQMLLTQLTKGLEILETGAFDDFLLPIIEEFKKQNVPFWQRHGKKITRALNVASANSEEMASKGKAPAPKTKELQSDASPNIEAGGSVKGVTKDGLNSSSSSKPLSGDGGGGGMIVFSTKDILSPSKPSIEQSLAVSDTPEKQNISGEKLSPQSLRKIESAPKAFFNPSNLLASSSAGFFALSSASTLHGIAAASPTTTTVSSVTLSAPTLSKLLEMPPSFAGKLPSLPISPRPKGIAPVQFETKSPQKVLFKTIDIPTTLEHTESNTGKFVAINVGENIKMDGKHILIKPSDVSSLLSKTTEHTQLILQQPVTVARSAETILAPTVQSDVAKNKQLENKNFGRTLSLPTSGSPIKQEEIVTYFKPKDLKLQDSSPLKDIASDQKTKTPADKPKDVVCSPTLQKLTKPSPMDIIDAIIKSEKELELSNSTTTSKSLVSPTKTVQKSHSSTLPKSSTLELSKDINLLKPDPFTFDETSDKFSDKTKTFSRGIKRKRESLTENLQSSVDIVTDNSKNLKTSQTSIEPSVKLEEETLILKSGNVKTTNLETDNSSNKKHHIEENTNLPIKQEISNFKETKQSELIGISSLQFKNDLPAIQIKTEPSTEESMISPSFQIKIPEEEFDQLIESTLKSDLDNKHEASDFPDDVSKSLSDLVESETLQIKEETKKEEGVYDFPSDEKNSDVKLRPRYSAPQRGKRTGKRPIKDMTPLKTEPIEMSEESNKSKENIQSKPEDTNCQRNESKIPSKRGRRGGRSKACDKSNKVQETPGADNESSNKVKTEMKMRKSTTSLSSTDMAEDESTTSSQDSEKEFPFQGQNNSNKIIEDQYKSDAEDVFEKKASELSDSGDNLSRSTSTPVKDTDTNDAVSVSSEPVSISASSIGRGKESKSRWSPQSSDPASRSTVVTPTTSDSEDSDNFEMSDDSTNPDTKQSKLKWADRESENKYKAWKKSISIVWREAANHRYANVFAQKVTDDVAPGYHSIVIRPMDLSTIKRNIDNGTIKTTEEFQRDVMMMFQNAIMYNSSDHDVYHMAVEMQRDVTMQIQDLATQLPIQDENKESIVSSSRNIRQTKVPQKMSQK